MTTIDSSGEVTWASASDEADISREVGSGAVYRPKNAVLRDIRVLCGQVSSIIFCLTL
jgi:hypothetical protein